MKVELRDEGKLWVESWIGAEMEIVLKLGDSDVKVWFEFQDVDARSLTPMFRLGEMSGDKAYDLYVSRDEKNDSMIRLVPSKGEE